MVCSYALLHATSTATTTPMLAALLPQASLGPSAEQRTFSSDGIDNRLAVAPVAIMTECALTVRSLLVMVKGRAERSMLSTSSVYSSDPQRSACSTAQHATAHQVSRPKPVRNQLPSSVATQPLAMRGQSAQLQHRECNQLLPSATASDAVTSCLQPSCWCHICGFIRGCN
jgi:hypothetical protein